MAALPYNQSKNTKAKQVEEMFDNISKRYDLLNHILSFRIDKIWRKRAISMLQVQKPQYILDVATGTGDFAIEATRKLGCRIVGVDISAGMLEVGKRKIEKRNLKSRIELIKADSEDLPFKDELFDGATVAFGVRNFENLKKGLMEIIRILKPGGTIIVLEFSKPAKTPFKQIYFFYFKYVLPFIGRIISKDRRAYTYLPESVHEFPDGDMFTQILGEVGFVENEFFSQTFGIACIYKGIKPEN